MNAHDRDKFLEAVSVELDGHGRMGNYEPISNDKVPNGTKLLDMVWSMRCKRRINTQEVYKWKARLNVHGGQQEHGVHYCDTYTPVVTWQTIQFFCSIYLTQAAQSATGFCHGVPASACRDAPLLALAPRIQTKGHDPKIPCAQAQTQCVWAEASRKSVEPIHGPRDEDNRVYSKQVRPMLVLPQVNHLLGIH